MVFDCSDADFIVSSTHSGPRLAGGCIGSARRSAERLTTRAEAGTTSNALNPTG